MIDGARIALQPNSELVVAEYQLPKDQVKVKTQVKKASGSSTLNLLKGGFRTITGSIGNQTNKDAYKVNTPVATIGIRGTDYSLMYCTFDCKNNQDGSRLNQGLYLGVSQGSIWIQNDAGLLDLNVNEFAYVLDQFSIPEKLLGPPPSHFGQTITPTKKENKDEESDDSDSGKQAKTNNNQRESKQSQNNNESKKSDANQQSNDSNSNSSDSDSNNQDSNNSDSTSSDANAESKPSKTVSEQRVAVAAANDNMSPGSGDSSTENNSSQPNNAPDNNPNNSPNNNPNNSPTNQNNSPLIGGNTPNSSSLSNSIGGDIGSGPNVGGGHDQPPVINFEASDGQGGVVTFNDGQISSSGIGLSFATAPFGDDAAINTVGGNSADHFNRDNNGNLTGFSTINPIQLSGQSQIISQRITADINTAQNFNTGFDPNSNIRWGRWSEGFINIKIVNENQIPADPGQEFTLDLNQQSLHWVAGSSNDSAINLARTGSAQYLLIGNTDPTNNSGSTGILGDANLTVNFSQQTVQSNLLIGINNQVWNASGQGEIHSGTVQFQGEYTNVSINSNNSGSGSFTGFFSGFNGLLNTVPEGAGLSYILSNSAEDEFISGVAVFSKGGN